MVGLLAVGAGRAGGPGPSSLLVDRAAGDAPDTTVATAAGGSAASQPADAGRASADPLAQAGSAPVPPDVASAPVAVEDAASLVVPEPDASPYGPAAAAAPTPVAASAPASSSEQIFAREHPEHAAARQKDDVASSFHWAVIIGINDYMGRTTSTIGSVRDAHVLRDTLYREGWRGDQVLTLTDHEATHDQIVRAIEWLIRSTDHRSTVVFSFSGHMRHESGVTALWPADNRLLWAGDFSRMLGAVRADRLWASLQGCHAAGLAAPGLEGEGRLLSYASNIAEKAYEDPSTGQSVFGYYLFAEGLRDARGAGSANGRVSVQDAFAWAAPRATSRTADQQPYGAQRPVLVDGLGGAAFPIAVTGAPPPPRPPAGSTSPSGDDGEDSSSGLLGRLVGTRLPGLLSD